MRPHHIATTLPVREPFAPAGVFGHLAATAVPGCEAVLDGAYRRTLRLRHGPAIVALRPGRQGVDCDLLLTDPEDEHQAVRAARRLLDLDADPVAVDDTLRADPALRPLVDRAPGQRLPGTVDPAELAVRAVLGQQVSTAAARTLAARLVLAHGTRLVDLPAPGTGWTDPAGELTHLSPTMDQLAEADPRTLAMPTTRRRTFRHLVEALAQGDIDLGPGCDVTLAREGLARIPGVGPWTVELIALRGLGDPDAFPSTDLGVRRAAEAVGLPSSARALAARAEQWRPFRAYAVQYLWSSTDHEINRWQAP